MENRAKILLIDDDYEYVNNFGKFLERRGYAVLKSGTGRFGIELAEKEKPNIILCDLLMLDINGEEVLKEVKKKSPDSIFIVVTSIAIGIICLASYDFKSNYRFKYYLLRQSEVKIKATLTPVSAIPAPQHDLSPRN